MLKKNAKKKVTSTHYKSVSAHLTNINIKALPKKKKKKITKKITKYARNKERQNFFFTNDQLSIVIPMKWN